MEETVAGTAAADAPAGAGYPTPPWRMSGPVLLALSPVGMDVARRNVPRDVSIVPVAPGRTLGALLLVRYEAGSTLAYNELIVFSALVRGGARPGLWVSHIYVDNEESLRGGRDVWRMPKETAEFELHGEPGDGRVDVRGAAGPLVSAEVRAPRLRWPQPLLFPLVSGFGSSPDRRYTLARGMARLGAARIALDVPDDSPIASVGLPAQAAGVAGHAGRLLMALPSKFA